MPISINGRPYHNVDVVIPHYPLLPIHDVMLKQCVQSLRGQCNTYVVVNQGMGFAAACNLGVGLTSSDYIAIVNNDTNMNLTNEMFCCGALGGPWNLMDICKKDTVTFPRVNGVEQEFTGAFLVIPRSIIDGPLGGQVYDEQFQVGFWEDVDLWTRLKDADVAIEQFPYTVNHPMPGSTMRYMADDTERLNRSLYLEKHGCLPIKNWN